MIIQLKTSSKTNWIELEIKESSTIEEIYNKYKNDLEYTVLAAKVDNKIEDLIFEIKKPFWSEEWFYITSALFTILLVFYFA